MGQGVQSKLTFALTWVALARHSPGSGPLSLAQIENTRRANSRRGG